MALEFEARYFLEHKALPNTLYNEGARLLHFFLIEKEVKPKVVLFPYIFFRFYFLQKMI